MDTKGKPASLKAANGPGDVRKKAVIYCRLSDKKENSNSIRIQEHDGRKKADTENLDVVAVLTDDGVSGGIERANAQRALEMLRTGEADVLIVWKYDRWSRQGILSVGDLMATLVATAPRTRFLTCDGSLNSDIPFFPVIAVLFAEQGRIERENIKARVLRSMEELATQGRYAGGITPFGWTPVPREEGDGFRLDHHPIQHPILREVIERVIKGERVNALCKELDERINEIPDEEVRAVLSPEGNGWYDGTMRRLLRNPILRGYLVRKANWSKMEFNLALGPDNVPLRPHTPACTDEEWYALQAELDEHSWKKATVAVDGHLLKGIAVCAHCGKNMGKRTRNLACSKHTKTFKCPGPVIGREQVEEYVTEQFLARYGDWREMRHVEVEQDTRRIREIMELLEVVARRIKEATTREESREWDDRMWELKDELEYLKTTMNGEVTVQLIEGDRTIREKWEQSTVDERRDDLATYIRRVLISKAEQRGGSPKLDLSRVVIEWTEDDEEMAA